MDWGQLAQNYGPLVVIVWVFVKWLDRKNAVDEAREARMAKRLDEVQDQHVRALETSVHESTLASRETTAALRELTKVVKKRVEQHDCACGIETKGEAG